MWLILLAVVLDAQAKRDTFRDGRWLIKLGIWWQFHFPKIILSDIHETYP